MELLLIVFGIFGAYILYIHLSEGDDKKEFKHSYQKEYDNVKVELQEQPLEPAQEIQAASHRLSETNKAEYIIIRDEIHNSVQKHGKAIKVLQSLARVDGSTSDPEKNLIFTFLQRNGEKLSFQRHRPFFWGFCSGEWQRSITTDEFKVFLSDLDSLQEEYKSDVYHTAIAIVACGGEPKKTEAECLELIKDCMITK